MEKRKTALFHRAFVFLRPIHPSRNALTFPVCLAPSSPPSKLPVQTKIEKTRGIPSRRLPSAADLPPGRSVGIVWPRRPRRHRPSASSSAPLPPCRAPSATDTNLLLLRRRSSNSNSSSLDPSSSARSLAIPPLRQFGGRAV